MTLLDPRTPVIVGAGQFLNRDDGGAGPLSPTELMIEALRAAEHDAGAPGALAGADVVAVVPVLSWRYRDPGRLLAVSLGAEDAATWYPAIGGNTPQMLLTRLAATIARGDADLGVVVGGEAYRSRMKAKRRGETPEWIRQEDDVEATWHESDSIRDMFHPAELHHGLAAATTTYPVFETAIWHDSGRTLQAHLAEVGRIWAGFSEVAAANPYAWNRQAFTAAEITTPTAENRTVSFPYTKRMVSNPDVDMAAGSIVCSVRRAEALGVPLDRWVFPLAGTDGYDRYMSERVDLVGSPAIGVAGNRALDLAGVGIDDVTYLDVYSCFPSAVQVACRELGIDTTRRLTVYGGLCFAGGPWNNPVGHAIASMVQVLRDDPGTIGLVTANGGNIQKHAFGLYSTEPPRGGFRSERPQAEIDAHGGRSASIEHSGSVLVEGWTVEHDRDGAPRRAVAATLTPDGVRVWASSTDDDVMKRFETEDVGGLRATVDRSGTLTLD